LWGGAQGAGRRGQELRVEGFHRGGAEARRGGRAQGGESRERGTTRKEFQPRMDTDLVCRKKAQNAQKLGTATHPRMDTDRDNAEGGAGVLAVATSLKPHGNPVMVQNVVRKQPPAFINQNDPPLQPDANLIISTGNLPKAEPGVNMRLTKVFREL
jgi:hypothetical protein